MSAPVQNLSSIIRNSICFPRLVPFQRSIYASFIQIYLVTNFTRLSAAGKKIPSFYGSINPGRVRSGSYQDISAAVIAFPTIASRRRNARPSNNVRRPGQAENFI